MKIFLTGGTGFIGQHLAHSLTGRGWEVVALVRKPDSAEARSLSKMGAQIVAGDVTDRESMRAGMLGADAVVHSAGAYEFGVTEDGKKLMHAINVSGADNVFSLARELNIPRTVFISATMYWGETGTQARDETFHREKPYHSYYEQTKAESHQIALDYQQRGLPLIILAPNGAVGPNDHSIFGYLLRLYLNRLLAPYAWAPDIVFSPAHVDDVAEGTSLAVEKGRTGETYILAGEPNTLREILALWATKPGGSSVKFYLPVSLAKAMFAPLEPVERLAGLPAVISREAISASVSMNYRADKAKRELGWTTLPAREMWLGIMDQERELLARRKKRDLLSRLKPVAPGE